MRRVMCWQCGRRAPMDEALARVRAGEDDPHCRDCGGILKSDTISFGQSLVPEVIDRALNAAAEADLLLAIGTTLQVQPVASMVPIAARAGAAIVIVNDQPTAMDALADVDRARADRRVLSAICGVTTARELRRALSFTKSGPLESGGRDSWHPFRCPSSAGSRGSNRREFREDTGLPTTGA